MRALVMIGDAYPHEIGDVYKENNKTENVNINWREEVEEIKKMGINIYSIQCLDSGLSRSYTFYKQMANSTNGYHLKLGQFSMISDMILAICFNQVGTERLEQFEQEIRKTEYGMNIGLRRMFDTMLKRKPEINLETSIPDMSVEVSTDTLHTCPESKYQVLNVDKDISIKDFVQGQGLSFKTGKGFYEFTKTETIGPSKEVVLMKKDTGELYEGMNARRIIGLTDANKKYKPKDIGEYRVFIQSTSYNRKLIAGTGFLYEAADYGRE